MKAWFKEVVDEDRVKLFMRKGFRIYPVFDDVLYSAREKLVGYHVSSTANREGILAKGLVPNGNPEQAVMLASKVIDNVKPPQIPEWVVRQDAVYAHPAMGNDVLMGGHYKNCDLYALFLPRERCWVGSQAIGGFCLIFDEVEGEKLTEQIKKAKKEAKLYWKYSCSLEDYLSNTEEFQKKDKAYGLDEILIMRPIPPSDLFLIGSWDEEGTFHETSDFKRFVKHEFKDSYRDILEKYKL